MSEFYFDMLKNSQKQEIMVINFKTMLLTQMPT